MDFGRSVGAAGALLETAAFLLSEEEAGRSTAELTALITCVELLSGISGFSTFAQAEREQMSSAVAKIRMINSY